MEIANRVRAIREDYHYAWSIVGIGTALRVTANFVSQAFGVVLVVLQDNFFQWDADFQWKVTAVVLAQVFRSLASGAMSPVAAWLGDRYGVRRSLLVAATLYVVGMLLLSTISHVWQLYLYYSFILGGTQAIFSVNIPTTVAAWFKKRLGVAVGVQQSLGGMGGAITAPALALLIRLAGWQVAFWIIAAVGGVIIFALLSRFHGEPADRGMRAYGAAEDDPPPRSSGDSASNKLRTRVFLQQVRRTTSFWNLIVIHHLGCVGHSIVLVHVVFYATTLGIGLSAASWIIFGYTLSSMASRFATPILADHFGSKGVMALAYTLQGVTVLCLFWVQEPWHFYLFSALFGIGFGGEMSAFLVINRQYYGMGPVRSVFGFQHLGSGLGMGMGGLLGALIFDSLGSYDWAWVISIAASLAGTLCIVFLQPTSRLLIPEWEESLPAEAEAAPAT